MAIYFISDLHFGHKYSLNSRFDNRPFFTVTEMDNALIDNWNNTVTDDDDVYILGDVSFYGVSNTIDLVKQLKGKKHLIMGNHDKKLIKHEDFKSLFVEAVDYKEIIVDTKRGKIPVTLSHYFMPSYHGKFKGGIMLHGHSHITNEHLDELRMIQMMKQDGTPCEIYNVGCMLPYMNYTPRTLDYIIEETSKRGEEIS